MFLRLAVLFVSLVVQDHFQRADSALSLGVADTGQSWQTLSGVWGITSHQAYRVSGGNPTLSVIDAGVSDGIVTAVVSIVGAQIVDFPFRVQDVNNYLFARWSTAGQIFLIKMVAGVATTLDTQTPVAGIVNGSQVDLVLSGTSIKTYIDHALVATNSSALFQTQTKHGLQASDAAHGNPQWSYFAVRAPVTHPATWIVSPTGTGAAAGTVADPFSWTAALRSAEFIGGGDHIQLRCQAGALDYNHTVLSPGMPWQVFPLIAGTNGNSIVIERYAPDVLTPTTRPKIHSQTSFTAPSGYIDVYDVDFGGDDPTRYTSYNQAGDPNPITVSVDLHAPQIRLINCLAHDFAAAASVGLWESAPGSEIYGSYLFNNGFFDNSPGQNIHAGHGIYTQNDSGVVHRILDNIEWGAWWLAMQAYGTGASQIKDYLIQGNTFFYNEGGVGLGGTASTALDNVTVDTNVMWEAIDAPTAFGMGYQGLHSLTGAVTNNYVVNELDYISAVSAAVAYFANLTVTNNRFYHTGANGYAFELQWIAATGRPAGTWDFNTYVNAGTPSQFFDEETGTNTFTYNTLALWTAATGYDAHSTLALTPPTDTVVRVRPNTLRPTTANVPRAHITVCDWSGASSAAADVSSCLSVGDSYAVWHVFDWVQGNNPTTRGVYQGGTIPIPLAAVPQPALVANLTPGTQSYHVPLVTPPAGRPSVYVMCAVPPASTGTIIATVNPISGYAMFSPEILSAGGLRQGDRYYVCHYADTLPEKFGRVALSDGVWQGGEIFCYIANAYPDAVGPFEVIKSGVSGTGLTVIHRSYLDADAARRRMS